MFESYKLKEWMNWRLVRAHLCTTAVAVSLNASWRTPRGAFTHGGVQYGLAVTAAMIGVALPLSLLQLAVGQLSQQDPVGVWRAVPFFKGVGYLRLLISFLSAVYSMIFLSLTTSYFLFTISNSLPFWGCIDLVLNEDEYVSSLNASACLKETFMAPVSEKPEYYLAVALIVLVLWIIFPFIFYNPVKLMKRILYVLGPAVIILAVVTVSCVGNKGNLAYFIQASDWRNFVEPGIWHSALIQALLTTQIAGGYLISAGDAVYVNTNVQWTALAFVGANIISTWVGLLFWYAISGADKDTGVFAVLIEAYKVGEEPATDLSWPLIMFLILILSGFISMLSLLFPIYDRFRRIGGLRWRLVSVAGSLVGAGVSLGVLALRMDAITVLDDYVLPMLVSFATLLEILAFVFLYGWKALVEDVEFLTGNELAKCWVLGWCAAPGIIAPFTLWWVTMFYVHGVNWTEAPWAALGVLLAGVLATVVFLIFAGVAVARQVQYDVIAKLKSSFKPSRHWGPRDPITHYYWLARREEIERGNLTSTRKG
ncbi:sodium- and chloride-dependent neutral and basic amino acid transporter B(0+)-like isoform X2 [Anticarsia gemmatalis]|uniref:sodium- and chloride-dependent neutral and basic amino acid transporter B(0+)-like isoform X2 n=1 Tax=Anticarsia gemmatalis TaxID=129554 RepID=UPI003F76CC0E